VLCNLTSAEERKQHGIATKYGGIGALFCPIFMATTWIMMLALLLDRVFGLSRE